MPDLPPDVNIRALLERAAADPVFYMKLLNNREAALKGVPLTAAETSLLLAATRTQIEKMVGQARHRNWYESPVTRRGAPNAAATGALTQGGGGFATITAPGHPPQTRGEQ